MPSSSLSPEKQCEILSCGAENFISKEELKDKLQEGRPLTVKAGFDPSCPDIHLGHLLLIGKLREFQDLGHNIVFVVGDWTACIGDPSGQNKTRPMLSRADAERNAQTYKDQAARKSFPPPESADQKTLALHKALRRLDPDKARFVFNSRWLDRLALKDFIEAVSKVTLARILERNDFSQRHAKGLPVGLHEFLYPVLQAYDSVELKADIEAGGADQFLNLLLGRELQKAFKQPPQCVLTLPLIEGLSGGRKMSQSLGNSLSFKDSPEDVFGKIMNLTDEMMIRYWERLGGAGEDYRRSVEGGRLHPMKEKALLAEHLTWIFYGPEAAEKAKTRFHKVFSRQKLPDKMPEKILPAREAISLQKLLCEAANFSSASAARRFIEGGGVQLYTSYDLLKRQEAGSCPDEAAVSPKAGAANPPAAAETLSAGKKLTDPREEIRLEAGANFILRIGRKRFLKIRVQEEKP